MRLPDISYGGEVRPLAKEDPDIAAKAAQVEIELSKAQLGADLDKASKIGQSQIRLAREMREVDKDKAWSQAKIATDAFSFKTDQAGARRNNNIQLVSSLAQTAISVAGKWYEAGQESSAAKGSANYSKAAGALVSTLANSVTVNLNDYPDVDFSQIPENMIDKDVDKVTGKKGRFAPNHLAAPLVYASEEPKIRSKAAEGIESRLALAKFDNAITQDGERHALTMISAKAKHEHEFLQGQYQSAIDTTVSEGDFPGAIARIDSAEARGVFTSKQAAAKRKTIASDVAYVNINKAIKAENTIEGLQAIQNSVANLPPERQTLVNSMTNTKINTTERKLEHQKVEQERQQVGVRKVMAGQIALAAGGLDNPDAAEAAIIKQYGGDGAHIDEYVAAGHQAISNHRANITYQENQAEKKWYQDVRSNPDTPIPGSMVGSKADAAEKYAARIKSGAPIATDLKVYTKLERMAGADPNAFKQQDLDMLQPYLDESATKHFSGMKSKMLAGEDSTQISNAHAVFDNMAKQVVGLHYAKSSSQQKTVNEMFQAYTISIEQAADKKGSKLTSSEMGLVANDIFKTKIQTTSKNWVGNAKQTELTLKDSDINKYVVPISYMLKAAGKPVNATNIGKEYSVRFKNGTLKELDEY